MKKLKRLMAAVLVGATILSFAGCSKAKDVKSDKDVEEEQEEQDIPDIYDEDTFFDALEKVTGITEKDMMVNERNESFDGPPAEHVTFTQDFDNSYCYIRYENAEDAMNAFRIRYDSLQELLETKEFEGSNRGMVNDKQGFLIMDGTVKAGVAFGGTTFFESDMHYYGIFYVNKNVYIEIFTLNGSDSEKEMIRAIIKEMNLPNM
jgi:hypothetical protein